MKLFFRRGFEKNLKNAPQKIQDAFYDRLDLFLNDQYHFLLRNHRLFGFYNGKRSINVTSDWRALYSVDDKGDVYFSHLGRHADLY